MSSIFNTLIQPRIDEVWHESQDRVKDNLAMLIQQSRDCSVLPLNITPLNLSAGKFIHGASRLLLRSTILCHYRDTGIYDPRFISLSEAHSYDLKLKKSSKPLYALTYATHSNTEVMDEETGEVISVIKHAPRSFKAYYEIYHLSQFDLTPNTPDSSKFKRLFTAMSDIDLWLSTLIEQFNIDLCISQNREVTLDVEKGTIKIPHPDFFRERHAFYFVALTQIVKWFLLTTEFKAVHVIREHPNEAVLDILGHLIVDETLCRLNIPVPKILNQNEALNAIDRHLSTELAMQLVLACEPLCDYLMSFTDIGLKSKGSQSEHARQISAACHNDLECFSEKPPILRVHAQKFESESIVFKLTDKVE